MGLMTFELSAGLQGQDNQSENYPSPAKGYTPPKPNDNIGPIPDKVSSHLDWRMSEESFIDALL